MSQYVREAQLVGTVRTDDPDYFHPQADRRYWGIPGNNDEVYQVEEAVVYTTVKKFRADGWHEVAQISWNHPMFFRTEELYPGSALKDQESNPKSRIKAIAYPPGVRVA